MIFHSHGELPQTFAVVGYGRVGKVLTRSLTQLGWHLVGLVDPVSTPFEYLPFIPPEKIPSQTDLILLTVPDSAIPDAVALVLHSPLEPNGTLVLHTAGAYGCDILTPLAERGFATLAFHPYQTITGTEVVTAFKDVTFGIDGTPTALYFGEQLARLLGGHPLTVLPEHRQLYHLSAVFSSNFLIGSVRISVDLLSRCGLPQQQCVKTLLPLIRHTVSNIEGLDLAKALTGPVARGDTATIVSHLHALDSDPDRREIYRLLSLELLNLSNCEQLDSKLSRLLTGHTGETPPALISDNNSE